MEKNYFKYSNTLHPEYNEDACYVCDTFGFVLDGATGLSGEHITPEKSDALWLVKTASAYLIEHLGDLSQSIVEIVTNCAQVVFQQYQQYANGKTIIDTPSCCISLFRVEKDHIVFFTLGDCPILIQFANGKVKQILRKDLVRFDNKIIQKFMQYKKKHHCTFYEAWKVGHDIILDRRIAQKNQPHGYYVLGEDSTKIKKGTLLSYPKDKIKNILIFSDGYAQIYDLFGIVTPSTIWDHIHNQEDADAYYHQLTTHQQADPTYDQYPRFKESDDATIIGIHF